MIPTATLKQIKKLDPCDIEPDYAWSNAVKLLRAYKNGSDIAYTVADARPSGHAKS